MGMKPPFIPGNNRDKVRRALAELGVATSHEVYMRASPGTTGTMNHRTVCATLSNLHDSGHVKRHPDGRVELTAAGRAMVENVA